MPVPSRAYWELVRPANVATALADVLAGAAIADAWRGWRLAPLLVATACLYAGGIVLNDYFDRELDAVERPERPIPSGRVPASRARQLGVVLLACGIAAAFVARLAAGAVAIVIAVLVGAYDAWAKPHGIIGPLNMGACRAFNLLLGVAAAPSALGRHWQLALINLAYITGITVLSRGEVRGGKRPIALASLFMVTGVAAALCVVAGSRLPAMRIADVVTALVLVVLLVWRVLPPFAAAAAEPGPNRIRRAVRAGVLSLVIVDAVFGAAYAGMIYGLVVLSVALLAGWLARQFAVT